MNKNVIVLSCTVKEEDLAKTRMLFSILPQRHRVIWASGQPLMKLYKIVEEAGL